MSKHVQKYTTSVPSPRSHYPCPPADDMFGFSEEIYKLICPYSLEIMSDPRTLPCGHTLDFSSLVSLAQAGAGAIVCPACRARFGADPRNLAVNTITKQIINGIQGLNTKRMVTCDRCHKRVSKLACQDCGMLFCQTCFDIVHQGRLQDHRWNFLDVAVQKDLPCCAVPSHSDYRVDLYCPATNEFLCILCQTTTHRNMDVYPVLQAAHFAKEDLQEWLSATDSRKKKMKSVTECIDQVIEGIERRTDDELNVLEELVIAFMDKIESQAKLISDRMIEHKIQEISKLCVVRSHIVNHCANMVDDVARAERAINLSDAIELVAMDREIVKHPPPLTIHLPQYSIPWVGPEGDFQQLFALDFLPSQDPCWLDPIFQDIVVPTSLLIEDRKQTESNDLDGITSIGSKVRSDFQWSFDGSKKGMYITLSTDHTMVTTSCPDCYDNSSVLGTTAMVSGLWMWKLRFTELQNCKQVCFGLTAYPFEMMNSKPYKNIWGWSTNGCALPSFETRCQEAKAYTGDEVWIKYDADIGKLESYWPKSGMSGSIDIGARAAHKRNVFPVIVLGRRGNTVKLNVESWTMPSR